MLLIISKKYVPSPTLFQQEQLNKIFELCGSPDEKLWPGVSKMPWFNNFKPARPLKRRVREFFRHFDRHALELLEKMLVLDPAQRISAKDALDAEYFWTDPLPCDPKRYLYILIFSDKVHETHLVHHHLAY
jgi:serine/threonine protein kinase